MQILSFMACLFLTFSAFAKNDFKDLALEYLETNSDVIKNRSDATLSKYDWQSTKAQFDWDLGWSSSYENDDQESAPFFNSNPLKTTSHSASLSKGFDWGGNFSFSNTFTTLRGSNPFGGLNGRVRGFSQGVTYSQDLGANFLGRGNKIGIANAETNYKLSEVASSETIELGLFTFYTSYLDARLRQALISLQKEAFNRAVKRRKLIAGRVRDGLREKVDLYQSQLSEMSQNEQVQTAKLSLNNSLEGLSKLLHRELSSSEIKPFDLSKADEPRLPSGRWQGNKSLQRIEKQMDFLRGSLKGQEYAIMPSVNLSASYTANDFNRETSDALKEGVIGGGNNNEVGVALTLSWPLGFKTQRIEKAKANVNLTTKKLEREKLRENFNQTEKFLKGRLKILEHNLSSVQGRVGLAKQALKEYNRLYNRGKADLDQVIRAEEDLIGTQRNFVQYLSEREKILASLAQLYGKLEQYLVGN